MISNYNRNIMVNYKVLYLLLSLLFLLTNLNSFGQVIFSDSFENDLSSWILYGKESIKIMKTEQPEHKSVMVLEAGETTMALIKNSDKWNSVSVEAEILFPDKKHNYLGFIYNYAESEGRTDFCSIYIKGNGSYLRVNPWRDGNVSRLLYEEYKTVLRDDAAIKINEWKKIKAEVIDNVCHFYVGDMTVPKLTFNLYENSSGFIGFNPRVTGWPVWVDKIKVSVLNNFTYKGSSIPNIKYQADSLITDWEVIGPFDNPQLEVEKASNSSKKIITINSSDYLWKPFQTDARGAVITGRITQYKGSKSVAYFRTKIFSDKEKEVYLHFSTTDELGIWINGVFNGFIYRNGYISKDVGWNAWYDFWNNAEHSGRKIRIALAKGENVILIRVRNGQFASGGFFAKIENQQ